MNKSILKTASLAMVLFDLALCRVIQWEFRLRAAWAGCVLWRARTAARRQLEFTNECLDTYQDAKRGIAYFAVRELDAHRRYESLCRKAGVKPRARLTLLR